MIRFENVSISHDPKSPPALDDVSVEVDRGEFVFIVGASGSGKSTFLSLVLRENKTRHGHVYVAGQNVANVPSWRVPKFRRGIGVVFQDFRLITSKTAFENVAYAMQVIGKNRAAIRTEVPRVLELVGLEGKEKRLPSELSGGEQQRVAIARAIVNRPDILLADEPTGNLDPLTSSGIMEILDRINQNGTTVVMATHDNDIVNSMRKRVIELVDGKVLRDEARAQYTAAIRLVPVATHDEDFEVASNDSAPQTRRQRTLSDATANVQGGKELSNDESIPPRVERKVKTTPISEQQTSNVPSNLPSKMAAQEDRA